MTSEELISFSCSIVAPSAVDALLLVYANSPEAQRVEWDFVEVKLLSLKLGIKTGEKVRRR